MTSTRTTVLVTTCTEPAARNNNQRIQGNDCSCKRIKDQCCLCMVSTGGYYALVLFAIYICWARSSYLAAIVFVFGIVILPVLLKLCWTKVQKWQIEKQTLRQNADTFYRLSVVGRENEVSQDITPQTLSVASNQSRVTVGNTDGMRSLGEGAPSIFHRTQLPPAYEQACSMDSPPTYEEAVQVYGLPKEEPNPTLPVVSVVNEL